VYRASDCQGELAVKLISGLRLPGGSLQHLLETGYREVAALRRELVAMAKAGRSLDNLCR
jgi:hypothetical protein